MFTCSAIQPLFSFTRTHAPVYPARAGGALALETAVVAAGAVVTAHGVGFLAHNATQPLQFSRSGTSSFPETKFPNKQLQSKVKHAKDFGVAGNYSPSKLVEFKNAIVAHINSISTKKLFQVPIEVNR